MASRKLKLGGALKIVRPARPESSGCAQGALTHWPALQTSSASQSALSVHCVPTRQIDSMHNCPVGQSALTRHAEGPWGTQTLWSQISSAPVQSALLRQPSMQDWVAASQNSLLAHSASRVQPTLGRSWHW